MAKNEYAGNGARQGTRGRAPRSEAAKLNQTFVGDPPARGKENVHQEGVNKQEHPMGATKIPRAKSLLEAVRKNLNGGTFTLD